MMTKDTPDTPHTAKDVTAAPAHVDRALDEISFTVEPEAEQAPKAAKHQLPRGSGEPRYAPRAYYYAASRSGVVPSWIASAH
jgi:hypothetical protein